MRATAQTFARREAFATCGSSHWLLESKSRPGVYKLVGDFCHDRWCVPCAKTRADTFTQNIRRALSGKTVRFMTLTLVSTNDSLLLRLKHLLASFRRLRRIPLWRRLVRGGCASIEITFNRETGLFHPHLHCLIEGSYFPQAILRTEWELATGDSRIVDIRPCTSHDNAAAYVAKYLVKPIAHADHLDAEHLADVVQSFRGVKQVVTFGTWRAYALSKPLTDDDWKSLGHWHELRGRDRDVDERIAALIRAIRANPQRALQGEFVLADLDVHATLPRPPPTDLNETPNSRDPDSTNSSPPLLEDLSL
jgi:hypothetical protein